MAGDLFSCQIIVGSDIGILKAVDSSSQQVKNLTNIKAVNKDLAITGLCWNNAQQTEVCVARRNQTVVLKSESSSNELQLHGGKGCFKGFDKLNDDLMTCTESGLVRVTAMDSVTRLAVEVGDNVCCARLSPTPQSSYLAVAGKEHELKVWNIESMDKPLFIAKNPPHDWLNLRKPVWVLDCCFMDDVKKIVSCTGYHQVRLYDTSAQKRPVIDLECGDSPLTTLSCRPDQQQVVVGNSHGEMTLVDLRGKGHVVHQYKGARGGLRHVVCNGTEVASCGLDRFVRIHDINTRQLLSEMYLKSRLNCVLWRDNVNILNKQQQREVYFFFMKSCWVLCDGLFTR